MPTKKLLQRSVCVNNMAKSRKNYRPVESIQPDYCFAGGKKKVIFENETIAQEKAEETELLFGREMKIYKCPFGTHYHLASR